MIKRISAAEVKNNEETVLLVSAPTLAVPIQYKIIGK